MELRFVRVVDDDELLRTWYDIRDAVRMADRPDDPRLGWHAHTGPVRNPWPGSAPSVFLAYDGATAVGWFALHLLMTENLDTAPGELEVRPDHRGRGIGRGLLEELVRHAREAGRGRVVAEAVTGSPGAALLTSAGATDVLADTQRRLDLTTVDDAELDRLHLDALSHASGYSLVQWVGATPEGELAAVAELESRMTTDAPMDDLAWEQAVFDAGRIRERDAVREGRRLRSYTTAARHDASGGVVALTCLVVSDGVDDAAEQAQTIVLPDHRGHRLGLLVKVANLRYLQAHEPAVRVVDTWNAASNAPMLRVNVAMGFRPVRQWTEWELRIPASAAGAGRAASPSPP